MGEAAPIQIYSIEEYLEIEKKSLQKYEYHYGEIFAMAGGTIMHSLLAGNIVRVLGNSLIKKGKSCRTFNSDGKIAITNRKFLYPDAFVVCGPIETFEEMPQAAKNPSLIVEVLSETTALYDRDSKFQAYQQINTLQEYVLISQDKTHVEVFFKAKDANFWQYRIYTNLEDEILLQSQDIEISMQEIYLGWEVTP